MGQLGTLHLPLEDDELLAQHGIFGQEIGAAAGQVKQAASGNRGRGWFGPEFDVFVNPAAQEGPGNEKVKHHSLLELTPLGPSRMITQLGQLATWLHSPKTRRMK